MQTVRRLLPPPDRDVQTFGAFRRRRIAMYKKILRSAGSRTQKLRQPVRSAAGGRRWTAASSRSAAGGRRWTPKAPAGLGSRRGFPTWTPVHLRTPDGIANRAAFAVRCVAVLPCIPYCVRGFWLRLSMVGLLLLLACQRPPANLGQSQPASSTSGSPSESSSVVVFEPQSGAAPVRVRVELARTPEEQARGLMYRRSLPEDGGMLFLFDRAEPRRFWMRNTYIPLDMIFLDDQRVVVGIEENTVPLDETGRGPDRPAQYVVEVKGGYARSHGIGIGARAQFEHVP